MFDRLDLLHRQRSDLKAQGRLLQMVSIQLTIVAETKQAGGVRELAQAWNYLSHLYHQGREYRKAELAARMALYVHAGDPAPNREQLGCYQFKLSQILAAQSRFAEAVPFAEAGIRSYAVFHNPPDEFLEARQNEAARMRELLNRATDADC